MKKQNKKKRKVAKQRSIIIAFCLMTGHFLLWLARWFYRQLCENTLLVVGFCLFAISFGFFSFNALFSQIKIHQDIFSPKKSVPLSVKVQQDSVLSKKKGMDQAYGRVIPIPVPNRLSQNSVSQSLQGTSSENLLEMQKKLAQLGFYDGPLDGLDGPKTRHAITLWKQQITNETLPMRREPLSKSSADEISVIIENSGVEIVEDTITTGDYSYLEEEIVKPSIADIKRVQEALRVFGNQKVSVTGVEDQETVDALKQFQKIFKLPITGKIDHKVLIKMREVGLLS